MSIKSNKTALLSVKSSVSLSQEEKTKKQKTKARKTLPRDSNTKLKLQNYQNTALPDEKTKVKSNLHGLSNVRVRETLFRILNNLVLFWSQDS